MILQKKNIHMVKVYDNIIPSVTCKKLLDLGEKGGLWKNVAGRYEMDGKKVYAKEIYKNPDKYFTDDIMEKLDNIAKEEYSYGKN